MQQAHIKTNNQEISLQKFDKYLLIHIAVNSSFKQLTISLLKKIIMTFVLFHKCMYVCALAWGVQSEPYNTSCCWFLQQVGFYRGGIASFMLNLSEMSQTDYQTKLTWSILLLTNSGGQAEETNSYLSEDCVKVNAMTSAGIWT